MENNEITFDNVFSYKNLKEAGMKCTKGVTWKRSTQEFLIRLCLWVALIKKQLDKEEYRSRGFTEFHIFERGKVRFIQSVHISERMVQKCLCQFALRPLVEPLLIEDNSASRVDMGTQYAINRLVNHLKNHYKEHGRKGGILVMDLHDYFHSIDQDILIQKYRELIHDDKLFNLVCYFINQFDQGLGLGSEISQTSAIYYANDIDHYASGLENISGYGRFMDDSYLISSDIEFLKRQKDIISSMYAELHIEMNAKKTQIIPFEKSDFEYLKKRYHITETGLILIRPVRSVFTRRRRLLKKQYKKWLNGKIKLENIQQAYLSWRGSYRQYDCGRSLREMDKLYKKLFNQTPEGEDIADIEMKKNLMKYGDIYQRDMSILTTVYKEYDDWRTAASFYKNKTNVIRSYDKLYFQLFKIPYKSTYMYLRRKLIDTISEILVKQKDIERDSIILSSEISISLAIYMIDCKYETI